MTTLAAWTAVAGTSGCWSDEAGEDAIGWECPQHPTVSVSLDDDTMGFSMAQAMAEANARSPATLQWEGGPPAELTLSFTHEDGAIRIPDPNFEPTYDDPDQEAWCQENPSQPWARANLELHLTTDDGFLDETVSVELPARLDEGGAVDLGGFDFDLDASSMGGSWTPSSDYDNANYSEVRLNVSGRYAEPSDIYLDEITVWGHGNGTIWGHATKAPGHNPDETCPANHGNLCDFPVAYFVLPGE